MVYSQNYIADYKVAKEEVLRSIPKEFITKTRRNLKIAYQHTSHGTQVTRGMYGLPDYKFGDDTIFAITNNIPEDNKLDLRDYAIKSYAIEGVDASDLSRNETAFIQATRNYLDDPDNEEINVVMWSWCNIKGHDVRGNYLPGMDSLINEYSENGSKIGPQSGKRKNPVTFIFMTGHGNAGANIGDGKPKNQAGLINNYCMENNQYCLDYYSIDTHDMDDNYWEDAGDNGQSSLYGGNFYEDYQSTHILDEHYYENKETPGGNIQHGAHNSQHITANRKAYAMWWILARIAGWDGIQNGEQDTEAPSSPKNLSSTAISCIQVNLEWDASTDNTGVTEYIVFRNNIAIGTTIELTYEDKALFPETTYCYYLIARDAAGNNSQPSTSISVTTLPDVDPPSIPQNLSTTTISTQQINIVWEPSIDDHGVNGYIVFRDDLEVTNLIDTFYCDVGLKAGTNYSYQVLAYDISGNRSSRSLEVMATTQIITQISNYDTVKFNPIPYPNPTPDIVYFQNIPIGKPIKKISLFSIVGKSNCIKSLCTLNANKSLYVDLSEIDDGIYIYVIEIGDEIIKGKICILKSNI